MVSIRHPQRLLIRSPQLRLLVALVLMIALYPWLAPTGIGALALTVFNMLIIATSIAAIGRFHIVLIVGALLGLPLVVLHFRAVLGGEASVDSWTVVTSALFYLFIAIVVMSSVFRPGPITIDKLAGSVNVYILFGFLWASLYLLVFKHDPESLRVPDGDFSVATANYFSFTTQTTLGYGDISPTDPRTHSMTILQSVSGVLYIAMVVARMVGVLELTITKADEAMIEAEDEG